MKLRSGNRKDNKYNVVYVKGSEYNKVGFFGFDFIEEVYAYTGAYGHQVITEIAQTHEFTEPFCIANL